MAALIGLGTLAMMVLDRRDGIVTTGITTVVIMVVAALRATSQHIMLGATESLFAETLN